MPTGSRGVARATDGCDLNHDTTSESFPIPTVSVP
jgi:hypothetical protein